MSKQAEAELILKLYDLRREPTMRKAREWFAMEFYPETAADVRNAMFGEHSGHLRMVMSYWDMAAALVKHEAISSELFNDTSGEFYMVFSRIEPLIPELRQMFGAAFMASLEQVIDSIPGGRERSASTRERMKAIREEVKQTMSQKANA